MEPWPWQEYLPPNQNLGRRGYKKVASSAVAEEAIFLVFKKMFFKKVASSAMAEEAIKKVASSAVAEEAIF